MVPLKVATASRSSSPLVSAIFLVVGIGLLGGAAALYYYLVQRPLTWPTTDATVISSRVVNPKGPSDHQPEIVFRLARDGREVTTLPSWSSGSYDMVRAYVDRYPAGATVTVAVNPADPDDVRYELGATFANLIVPGVVGLMGLLFAAIGWHTLRGRAQPAAARASPATLRWVSMLFLAIGLIIVAIGGWLLRGETPLSWPTAEAEVVESQIVTRTTSSRGGRNSGSTVYDVQATFRYAVQGTTYTSRTTSGSGSSSRSSAAERLTAYAPGARHAIRYRPDDPNVIRFEVTPFKVYVLPGAMLAMGAVFLGFGLAMRKFTTV